MSQERRTYEATAVATYRVVAVGILVGEAIGLGILGTVLVPPLLGRVPVDAEWLKAFAVFGAFVFVQMWLLPMLWTVLAPREI